MQEMEMQEKGRYRTGERMKRGGEEGGKKEGMRGEMRERGERGEWKTEWR